MTTTPVSWKRSFLFAAIACYAPFLLSLAAIDIRMLPTVNFSASGRSAMGATDLSLIHLLASVGPSLPSLWMVSNSATGASSGVVAMTAIATVVGMIAGVAALGRKGRATLLAGAVVAFIVNCISAVFFYMMATG